VTSAVTIIDTIIHHILHIHTNDAYYYDICHMNQVTSAVTGKEAPQGDHLRAAEKGRSEVGVCNMYHNNRHNYTKYLH
jgi:hypothetical protein